MNAQNFRTFIKGHSLIYRSRLPQQLFNSRLLADVLQIILSKFADSLQKGLGFRVLELRGFSVCRGLGFKNLFGIFNGVFWVLRFSGFSRFLSKF